MTVLLVLKVSSCFWCFYLQVQELERVLVGTNAAKAAVVVTVTMPARATRIAALTTANTVRKKEGIFLNVVDLMFL